MPDELFSSAAISSSPLADRMRPRTLDEFIGQEHIVGEGRLLRRAITRDRLSSVIFSGPPGTGKTTLARIIAGTTRSRFIAINAVLSGVQAIRDATESAVKERDLYSRRTILFVDEVHRWNKAQQDALLPYVENGTIVLIGATTENPFFEVNKALVSRSRVFQLMALSEADLTKAAEAAIHTNERGYGAWNVSFEDGALAHLIKTADGDTRSLLNALELAVETSVESWPPPQGADVYVSMAAAEESIQKRAVLYDRDGDVHYDTASAFIKSIRGSDPDAALYWLARMIYAGEDPRFIFRRLLISAAEDIGLADPNALAVVESAAAAYERIGLPEGQYHLALATLYLATAPKSNSAIAYFDALKTVETEHGEVPDHLKDASRDADGFGHGKGYMYPHAFREHWTAQNYMPKSLRGAVFYRPGSIGYECGIRDEVLRRRDVQLAAWLSSQDQAAKLSHEMRWTRRGESAGTLADLRAALFDFAFPKRHANILIANADDGLLLREAVRLCPEGSVSGLVRSNASIENLNYAFSDIEDIYKPELMVWDTHTRFEHSNFDMCIAAGFLSSQKPSERGGALARFTAFSSCPTLCLVLAERVPVAGIVPGFAVQAACNAEDAAAFVEADKAFYASDEAPGCAHDEIEMLLHAAGFASVESKRVETATRRTIGSAEIELWFSSQSAYGAYIRKHINRDSIATVSAAVQNFAARGPVPWPELWTMYKAYRYTPES